MHLRRIDDDPIAPPLEFLAQRPYDDSGDEERLQDEKRVDHQYLGFGGRFFLREEKSPPIDGPLAGWEEEEKIRRNGNSCRLSMSEHATQSLAGFFQQMKRELLGFAGLSNTSALMRPSSNRGLCFCCKAYVAGLCAPAPRSRSPLSRAR